jgi:glucose-1-phosphate thymidylyltransferase
MKCVLLAAGYATRLYPITKDMPKSLLRVGGKTILEYILAKIDEVHEIDEIILVTNSRFSERFREFVVGYRGKKPICVLDDGSSDNEHRLGAVADLVFAIGRKNIDDDVLVLAGDNLFDFSLAGFVRFFEAVNADCITSHVELDTSALRKTGVAELNAEGRVLSFEEKPREPKSNHAVPPFYLYRKDTLPLIRTYVASGENVDAPGQFVRWLAAKKPVYAFEFSGRRYDIGSIESYEEVKKIFGS